MFKRKKCQHKPVFKFNNQGLRSLKRNEQGVALIVVLVSLFALVGFVALAVDVSLLFFYRTEGALSGDLAVLTGTRIVEEGGLAHEAETAAEEILRANLLLQGYSPNTISNQILPETTIELTGSEPLTLTVSQSRSFGTIFGRIFAPSLDYQLASAAEVTDPDPAADLNPVHLIVVLENFYPWNFSGYGMGCPDYKLRDRPIPHKFCFDNPDRPCPVGCGNFKRTAQELVRNLTQQMGTSDLITLLAPLHVGGGWDGDLGMVPIVESVSAGELQQEFWDNTIEELSPYGSGFVGNGQYHEADDAYNFYLRKEFRSLYFAVKNNLSETRNLAVVFVSSYNVGQTRFIREFSVVPQEGEPQIGLEEEWDTIKENWTCDDTEILECEGESESDCVSKRMRQYYAGGHSGADAMKWAKEDCALAQVSCSQAYASKDEEGVALLLKALKSQRFFRFYAVHLGNRDYQGERQRDLLLMLSGDRRYALSQPTRRLTCMEGVPSYMAGRYFDPLPTERELLHTASQLLQHARMNEETDEDGDYYGAPPHLVEPE